MILKIGSWTLRRPFAKQRQGYQGRNWGGISPVNSYGPPPELAANYAEARAGESARDFIHKLKLTLKELREALFWLRLTNRLRMTPSPHCEQLLAEANELVSILVVSIKTARRRQPKP